MSRIQFTHAYNDIISVENLLEAWKEFLRGKRKKADVQEFQIHLMGNILSLHNDLKNRTYTHGAYQAFNISDPKPRNIHKASVRDRLLHHGLYRQLYPFFDRAFIADSYSCRKDKGTHKAANRLRAFAYKVSKNHTRTCWVLKCDIKKFFASIDHQILMDIVTKYMPDKDIVWLIGQVVKSFNSGKKGKGMPLGNLTSQLLVNIYMNEFDQFVKHKLRVRYYIRYADDFVVLSRDKERLENILKEMEDFLWQKLKLTMHPHKVSIQTFSSGVDFLGWIHFPTHRVLRTVTKKRMLRRVAETTKEEVLASYLWMLGHGDANKLKQEVLQNCL